MKDLFPVAQDPDEVLPAPALHTQLTLIESVSHEIRGAFGIISGLHSLLPLASGEEERDDMFSRLQNNTEYAMQLFTDLEDYCAMETGRVRIEPALFKPSAALGYTRRKALPMLERRNVVLMIGGESEEYVTNDEEKVRRIMKNMLFHLTCVMRVRQIEMGWEKRSTAWVLQVAYQGDALPEWLFIVVTEPDSRETGRHISLLLVRRLVMVLGGSICGGTSNADGLRRVSLQFPL